MDALSEWLQKIGLERYAAVFAASDVDLNALRLLSDADLVSLGLSLGHRRTLLKAIEELRTSDTIAPRSPDSYTPKHLADRIPTSKSPPEGERRQLTVLFCDMVGFTELANRVDPEVLQRIIRSYEDGCAVCIARYEGYVFQRLGDGIVAFFGYPLAHEGEAERAIRAGLEIIETLSKLDVPDAGHLAVRIGIATGVVVVSSTEKGAVGETMNLASRLQGIAPVGGIVVSERVHRLAGGAFDYQDLGAQTLKGIARPTRAYRIVGVSEAASRFEAATQEGLTPLVGREQEIGLLLERWALARDGEGQVVLLSGEPGIGKSRILSALRERLEGQGAQALRLQCSPYYVNSAFWPSIDNFERALKCGRDESPASRLDKLEALIVTHYGRPLADVRFIASMLSIPCDERYGAISTTPEKHKDETLRTLVDLTETAARKQPSVMLYEDLHWADPTTLELLDLLIDRVRSIPLLIVLTHRPEFQNRWASHGHVISLNLSKLTRAQSGAVVSRLARTKALPPDLLEQILTKTDGVPLFVEELTKSILESGELKDAGDHYEYVGSAHSITIPATLRDSLMARLDRFMPVKEIAQIGAAIGREFSYELIAAVAPSTQTPLDVALSQLTASGLAFKRGTPPDATYTFKHALVQDAAYDSLLKSRRQVLHGKIARVLEEDFPKTKDTEPELLAHHALRGHLWDKAVRYSRQAGNRALDRSAARDALAAFDQALAALRELPENRERTEQLIDLCFDQRNALYALGELARLGQVLNEGRALAEGLGDQRRLGRVLGYLAVLYTVIGEPARAIEAGERACAIAEAVGDLGLRVVANYYLGNALWLSGDRRRAADTLRAAIGLLKKVPLDERFGLTGLPAVLARWLLAAVLAELGEFAEGLAAGEEGLRIAQTAGHPYSEVWIRVGLGYAHLRRGDFAQATRVLEPGLALCRAMEIRFALPYLAALLGSAYLGSGHATEAVLLVEEAVEAMTAMRMLGWSSWIVTFLADAYLVVGRVAEAREQAQQAVALARAHQQLGWEAWGLKLLGDIHAHAPAEAEQTEDAYRQALALATEMGMRPLVAHCHFCLGRLYRQTSKGEKAEEHFTTATTMYREMDMQFWLEQAEVGMRELA